jgi:tyrosine-protein phosphatase SIW14
MKKSILRGLSVLTVVLTLVSAPSFAGQQIKELPNFQKVTDRLYRGAQPRPGGIKKLAELGINTVINLRGEDEMTRAEQKEVEALGLRYYGIPMGGLSRPSDEEVKRVLDLINAPENGNVFIHCKHGADRTGTVIACYRISQENYSAEKAQAEAKKYGMSWVQFGMKGYIADYYKKRQTAEPTAPGQKAAPNQKAVSEVDAKAANHLSPLLN